MARSLRRGRTIGLGVAVAVVVAGSLGFAAYVWNRDYTTPTAAFTPAPSPTATAAVDDVVAPAYTGARYLVAVDDQHAWRSASGSCSDPAFVETTSDGGATWLASAVTGSSKPTGILALTATSPAAVVVTAEAADGCTPSGYATSDGGASWGTAASSDGAWWIRPSDFRIVTSGGVVVDSPCQGRGIVGHDASNALLVCTDGVVFRTTDGAASWDTGGTIPGILSGTPVKDGYLVALKGDDTCAGIQFRRAGLSASAADGAMLGCHVTTVTAGATAIAASPSGIWVWTGDRIEHVTEPWALGIVG